MNVLDTRAGELGVRDRGRAVATHAMETPAPADSHTGASDDVHVDRAAEVGIARAHLQALFDRIPLERIAYVHVAGGAEPAGIALASAVMYLRVLVLVAVLANRILAVVQARLDNGGRLTDDELVTDIENVLRDNTG